MNRIESKVYSVQIRKNLFKNVTPIKIRMSGGRHQRVGIWLPSKPQQKKF